MTEDGKVRAEAIQLPLRLAWAITIHKSQGMSLDAAEIDLSKAFTPGMGYVALSRVRSLDGLYIKGINRMALSMHPQIYEFDNYLRMASSQLSLNTEDMDDETAEVRSTIIDEDLFEKLKQWRLKRSKADNVPPYIIAHNASLSAIAAVRPVTSQQLLSLSGFGTKKVETYGADIIAIVKAHLG
jgi:ATP-dependent DNA helicase PIF1